MSHHLAVILIGIGVLAVILIGTVIWTCQLAEWAKQAAQKTEHQQWLRDAELAAKLRADGDIPVRDGMPAIKQKLERAWESFVQAHEWPGSCPDCVWWIPSPSEAEDAIAVYQPCPRHDPALWPEQEKRAGQ